MTRAEALRKLANLQSKLSEMLENGEVCVEGPLLEKIELNIHNVAANLDLSRAMLLSKRIYRKDRNVFEKVFYVSGIICKKHVDEQTIVFNRKQNLMKGENLCLFCQSEDDEQLNNLIDAHGLKRGTVIKRLSKGETLEQIQQIVNLREDLKQTKEIRTGFARKKQLYKNCLTLAEAIKIKLCHESDDLKIVKLQELLTCLNCEQAEISQQLLNGKKMKFVINLSCIKHDKSIEGSRQLGRLLEGANPCSKCRSEKASLASKGRTRPKWTTERLHQLLKNEEGNFKNCISHIDFTKAKIIHQRKGNRNIAHVVDLSCRTHQEPILKPLMVAHFLNGFVYCEKCRTGYTEEKLVSAIEKAHQKKIKPLNLEGGILGKGEFECANCGNIWSTSVNNILGSDTRLPTGCSKCSSVTHNSELDVLRHLELSGYAELTNPETDVRYAIQKLRQSQGIKLFFFQVIMLRERQRELRIDFLIKGSNSIFALEIDGPQHYGKRFRDYTKKDFSRVSKLDVEKVKSLGNLGVPVKRIPLPLINSIDDLEELIQKLDMDDYPYMGVPNQIWLE